MEDCKYKDDYNECPKIKDNRGVYLDNEGNCICHRKNFLGVDESICNGEYREWSEQPTEGDENEKT